MGGGGTIRWMAVGGCGCGTTPVGGSEGACQRRVRGRGGRRLGVALGVVCRFLPLVRRELAATRGAMRLRLGAERPWHGRFQLLTTTALARTFRRADRLADALRVRCLAWNPTLPELRFGRADAVGLACALALFGVAFLI